jgi:pimeloyl-ACP methyl ester carboxylesterase
MSEANLRHAISADGTPIAYSCFGDGHPILFVHGTVGTRQNWQAVAERLSDRFSACTMDRRGRGGSGDGTPYAHEREAEDVIAVAEALGRVVVVGHSFGGPPAIEAAMASDAVRALVVYEGWDPPLIRVSREDLEEVERLVSLGRYEDAFNYGDSPEQILQSRQLFPDYAERVAAMPTFSREVQGWEHYWQEHPLEDERRRALGKEVLLLVGERNLAHLGPSMRRLAEHLPRVTILVLEGQGHVAYREDPGLAATVIGSWVASLDTAGDR